MRSITGIMVLAVAFLVGASVALAQDGGCDVNCAEAACGSCNSGCCGGLVFDTELTFLRYFQEGGVTDGVGSPAETDYEFAPRFVLGYAGANGLGVRVRYFELDASVTSVIGNAAGVNAYTLDTEFFQEYSLGCDTTIEFSLGLRQSELWLDSTDLFTDPANPMFGLYGFSGFGGTMGAQVNRNVLNGSIYARARMSLLMGDAVARGVDLNTGLSATTRADDCTAVQTELGIGYEICRCTSLGMVTLRSGVEWQNWANMAIADTGVPFFGAPGGDEMEDAGLAGFVVGFGLER